MPKLGFTKSKSGRLFSRGDGKLPLIGGFLAFIAFWLVATVVLAISSPDSTPILSNIHANRNLAETGDVLIYGEIDIPYATPPSVSATEAFTLCLMDGTDEIGCTPLFTYMDNGYNEGVFGFYFTAADNLTWGQAYIIRILENPAHFATPTHTDYEIDEAVYTAATTQDDNQQQLAINILSAASRLEVVHTSYDFIDTTGGGTVLASPDGETYFREAIYGLQLMAPTLFDVQQLIIDTSGMTWTTDQFDEYEVRFDPTWVGATENATATQFGITPGMVGGMLFVFPLCIGAIILSSIKYRRIEPGLVVAFLFLIMGAVMGWMPQALFATLYQTSGIYLAYVIFYSRG